MQHLQHPQQHHTASPTTRRMAGALVAIFGALLLAFGWAAAPVAASGSQPSGGAVVVEVGDPCQTSSLTSSYGDDCQQPCEYDESLPAGDPDCVPPPCEWNPYLGADAPDCVPPCEYNEYLPSNDPGCVPPCEYNEYLPSNDPGCEPETTVVETTVPETTAPETTAPETTVVEQVPPTVTETTDPQPPEPVAPAAAPATTVAAQTQVAPQAAAAPARLPETGGNTSIALFGGLFVLFGATLVIGARRPATGRS